MTPTLADLIQMRIGGWWVRLTDYLADAGARHEPRGGDEWRSRDGSTIVRVMRPTTIRARPAYSIVVERGDEVTAGDVEHAALVELVRGYRLASRGAA